MADWKSITCWRRRASIPAMGKAGPAVAHDAPAAESGPVNCPASSLDAPPPVAPEWPRFWARCRSTPCRFAVYALVLAGAAGWVCFYRLGDGTLSGDEAAFALTSERMLENGDWVVLYITDEPHLNATPLYNWLTLLTGPCFDDGPLRYRFWSAAFGVGCVLLTLVIGTVVFRPEAGLLAGLLLTTNRYFVHFHGARFGGMDVMLAFFVTGAAACYLPVLNGSRRPGLWWALVGGCVGLALLSKPPVMGGFFFATLVAHFLYTNRCVTPAARLRGPLLALFIVVGVAAPWYLLLASRLGTVALEQLFIVNSVTRAMESPSSFPYDPFYYCNLLVKSSLGFALIAPALLAAGWRVAVGPARGNWGLLVAYPLGLFLALSLAHTQALTYLYPTFPLVSVLVAGLFVEPLPALPGWLCRGRQPRMVAVWLASVLAALIVLRDARQMPKWFANRPAYPPWEVYQRARPVLDRHEGRIIMFGFQRPDLESLPSDPIFVFDKLYYERHMHGVQWMDRLDDLQQTLADGKPTLVFLPQPAPAGCLQERGLTVPPEVQTVLISGYYAHALLAFHGAFSRFDLGDLFQPPPPCAPPKPAATHAAAAGG